MGRIDPRFESLIGDDYFSQDDFNLEEAANRNPDLIITSARTAWLDTVSELGVPYFLYDAETPEALKEAILLTGQLFGPNTAAQAEAWVAYYNWIEAAILEQTDSLTEDDQVRVLFTGTSPLRVASGDMIQSSLIEIAGGISVSAELTGYWNDVNLEQVAAWNPDLILVPTLRRRIRRSHHRRPRLADPRCSPGRPGLPNAQTGCPLGHTHTGYGPRHHLAVQPPVPRSGHPGLQRTGTIFL